MLQKITTSTSKQSNIELETFWKTNLHISSHYAKKQQCLPPVIMEGQNIIKVLVNQI